MQSDLATVAEQLNDWFRSIVHSTGESLFSIAPEGPHRDAVVLDVLKRNARILSEAELDSKGKLYSPLLFLPGSRVPQAGDLLGCRALASGVGQCGSLATSDSERPRGIRNGRAGGWEPSRAL